MLASASVVLDFKPHIHPCKGCDDKVASLAKELKLGNTTVKIFSPSAMDNEELQSRLDMIQMVSWDCWESLDVEQQSQLNKDYE